MSSTDYDDDRDAMADLVALNAELVGLGIRPLVTTAGLASIPPRDLPALAKATRAHLVRRSRQLGGLS